LFLTLFALSLAPACSPEEPTTESDPFYTEEWDQAFFEGKDDGVRLGRFETFTGADGRSYFHLLAGNGQKVLRSQGYADARGAANGIDSVRENGADPANFRVLEAADGRWYFNLIAGNGWVIGTSGLYGTQASAARGVGTVVSLVEGALERAAARRAAFQVFRGLDGQYYFHLRARNGEIVLQSEGYTRRTSAIAGTASVETNGVDPARYQIREAASGAAHFVLRAGNGQIIAHSETYADRPAAEHAAAAVAELLQTASIAPAE
jgi:uncharacterized protein YegP (UPF0339 family)